ncbi:trimethylamine methyltransferase family protein [Pseudahrensia aquimaris]|uniref:Methyltransferase n=1 Tax=Pseudahrensia aquimaris TaxID=744461 RepID=A0ABW3FDP0_9HYPH
MSITEEAPVRVARSGGRNARRNLRAAPLADDVRPIRAGLEGTTYKPLSEADVEKVHGAVLDVLENIGLSQATPTCIEACESLGAIYGEDGRLRFPRDVVMGVVASANRDFALHGRDPKHDMHPQGSKVHFGTAGAAVHVVDVEKNEYRESYLRDIYDAARIVEGLDNIHFFQRPMVARDVVDPKEMDLNTLFACLSGTTKHIGTSFTLADYVPDALQMMYRVAGGEEAFRARPFVSNSNCFVVPPLRFAADACDVLEECVKGGMPVLLLSAGQAGATAPAAIAGAVVQAVAEVLAGLVYVNALAPGHPAIFGTWPFVSDLRTGAMSGGSGEQALLTAACGQMANFYNLPGGSAAGMCDAKMPDIQAGWEKGIAYVLAGMAGTNLVYEAAGMHGSLMGFCLESLFLDNDALGQAQRCVRGIEVNDQTLSIEAMRDVCVDGPGHYLGHGQTLELMQREYLYPDLANRFSPKEWVELGKPDIVQMAIERKKKVLAEFFPDHVDEETDAALREEFVIHLAREHMGR